MAKPIQVSPQGTLPKYDSERIRDILKGYAGTTVTITIKAYKKNRSQAQNRLFHKWVNEIAEQTSHPNDAMKEWLKRRYLGEETLDVMGESITRTRSTAKLGVEEFKDFMTKIEVWAQEVGIQLTYPVDYQVAMYGN